MTTERELQTYFVEKLRKNGWHVFNTSSYRRASSAGVPDVIAYDLLMKRVRLFEVKGPKTPLSAEQEKNVRLGAVMIVRDKETADRIVWRVLE